MIATDLRKDTLSIEARQDFTTLALVDGLDAESLELRIRGGAQVTATGSVGSVALDEDEGATVNLEDLSAHVATVSMDGGATATLTAVDDVTGTAAGGSRLTVLGEAVVLVQESGGSEVDRGG